LGLPVRWQGWLLLASYFALIYLGLGYFREQRDVAGVLIYLAAISVLLVVIVALTGEKPLKWRWGK
jgi:hypothetical protein